MRFAAARTILKPITSGLNMAGERGPVSPGPGCGRCHQHGCIVLTILLIDDHTLFREGLVHVLHALEEEVRILEAADYERALQHAREQPDIDLVLLDLGLPGRDGFSVLDTFAEHYPAMPVVILSASNERSDIQRTLDAGAMGYIPKDTPGAVMLNALRLVLSGGVYVPRNLATLAKEVAEDEQHAGSLTRRQLQVLALLSQGFSNKQIGNELQLAEATVKMHVTSIMKVLGVTNRTQAAMAAEKLGLAALPD